MMAFIEQEAKEKVEEIDAKVAVVRRTLLGFACIFLPSGTFEGFSRVFFPRQRRSLTSRRDAWCRLNG